MGDGKTKCIDPDIDYDEDIEVFMFLDGQKII